MSPRIVTISGPPGSGKTTAGRLAALTAGVPFRSAGELFRAEAASRGVDLDQLSRMAESDPSIDQSLDQRLLDEARPREIVEGRITGALLRRRSVPVFYVVVDAEDSVRFQRVSERDHLPLEEARRRTSAREKSEQERFWRYYQVELRSETADLKVDSTRLPPSEVARLIAEGARSAGAL